MALLALVVASVALLAIVLHALIPTPPAHVADPLGLGVRSPL
jgi:hypothetical protein